MKAAVSASVAAVSALGCLIMLGGAALGALLLVIFPPGR